MPSRLLFSGLLAGVSNAEDWEIASGAVLSGSSDFGDSSISKLAGQGLSDYGPCLDLCAKDSACQAFDFVGAKFGADEASIGTGDCWFRLDDTWSIKPNSKRNHTSGRRAGPAPPSPPSPSPPSPSPSPSPPSPSPPSPPAPSDAKNVLFVLFDDYRAMHKTYGWNQAHLPNAERLAAESLVFDHTYVQQAVCGPSRASLLSGRRPDRTQMWNFVDGDAPGGWRNAPGALDWNSWPQYFGTKGYYVAATGKLYHRGDPNGGDPPSWTEPECKSNFPMYGQGSCPNSLQGGGSTCAVDTSKHPECFNGKVNCFPDNKTLDKGVEFLRKAAKQQPFWLGVGFVKPHEPHIYPKEFEDVVPKLEDIDVAPNPFFPKDSPPIAWLNEGPMKNIDKPATDDKARELRHAYYSAAAYTDLLLGVLLDELDALGLRDNTLVVMTADHGWGLGEHNHWIKYTNFETDARVPLFIRAPWMSKSAGKRASAIVELVDLYPTTAALAGVPVDASQESVDGTSFAHLFETPADAHKDAAFSQYPRCWNSKYPQDETAFPHMARCSTVDKNDFAYMGYSIRTDRWRYTEWAKWDGKNLRPIWEKSAGVELYDHDGDDGPSSKISFEQFENVNVASQNPSVVVTLSKQLRDHFDNDSTDPTRQDLVV